jgi:outer membrane protein assembly factor BamD (BamD/ComL family)
LAQFEKYDAPSGILGVGSISFYASILKENGSLDKAAETYVEAAEWDENNSTTPYNLLEAAKIYYDLGNYDEAQVLVERIIREYPTSAESTESLRLEGMISASL